MYNKKLQSVLYIFFIVYVGISTFGYVQDAMIHYRQWDFIESSMFGLFMTFTSMILGFCVFQLYQGFKK